MDRRDYYEEAERMLAKFGGFYKLSDILEAINNGQMQSFVFDNTWAVTQINEFPRRKVLEVVLLVGDKDTIPVMARQIESFAAEIGATMIMAAGRNGFKDIARGLGWTHMNMNFVREVSGT